MRLETWGCVGGQQLNETPEGPLKTLVFQRNKTPQGPSRGVVASLTFNWTWMLGGGFSEGWSEFLQLHFCQVFQFPQFLFFKKKFYDVVNKEGNIVVQKHTREISKNGIIGQERKENQEKHGYQGGKPA